MLREVELFVPGADRRRRPHRYHLDALELLDDGKKEALQAEYLVSNLGSVPQIGNAPSCF